MTTTDIYRAEPASFDIQEAEDNTIRVGIQFARFDAWNEINSRIEGHFLERVAPGAFADTFVERASKIQVLYDHGFDPQIGNKPLGTVVALREDPEGPFGEVELFGDASYVRDLLPALRAGVLGASYRFTILDQDYNRSPARSEQNPTGLPERTIKKVLLREFGPVTFPADEETSVKVRSLTDKFADRELFIPASEDAEASAVEARSVDAEALDEDETSSTTRNPYQVRFALIRLS